MKKIVIFIVAIMLISTTFVAASNNPNQQNTNQKNNEINASPKNITNASNNGPIPTQNANQVNTQQQTSNQGNNSNIGVQQQTQVNQNDGNISVTPQNTQNQNQTGSNREQQIRLVIQQKTQEVNSTMGNSLQNQKMAQVAVQTMEATALMFGTAEENVSGLTAQIMNSLEITFRAEEQINNRNGIVKFIAGGDDASAELIEQQTIRNEERIRELNIILQESDFDPQTKAILQEQIRNIEQEQLRLNTLAEEQKNNKGLLGWLWK